MKQADPDIEVRPPEVKVLPPSSQEVCDRKKKDKKSAKVTLVCVATDFYPDHIKVSWKVNGKDATDKSRTDNAAQQGEDKRYSISSRLRVSAKVWSKPSSTFTCITSFYNGSTYLPGSATINGGGVADDSDYLVKATLSAKLSYGVFIAKSCLYGLFVSIVVWKLQGKTVSKAVGN
ncbi:hypothetical protein MATL_G00161420 [Megalops atlanticus]|uniref:Ig-like domain-containing protein n=1 Tax=Megalops atlanticus TaxID=7932 RepID=A0A9D3PQK1_MEGAT|nr:hypothetical protein MATL_G00161420 [Megalops atlanticus]